MKVMYKQMSNRIHNDKCQNVSSMTTANKSGIKSMSHNKLNNEPKAQTSAQPATMQGECIMCYPIYNKYTSLCVNPYIENNYENMYTGNLNDNYTSHIANKISFTSKCSTLAQSRQNTHINKPKTTRSKQKHTNLSKPIPIKETSLKSAQNDLSLKVEKYKKEIMNWISSCNPTHFLTIQLPEHWKTSNFELSQARLKKIMASFEYRLYGRKWHKKHLYFMAVAEQGHSDGWHYHIVFNRLNFTEKQLEETLLKTTVALKLPSYTLDLRPITVYQEYVTSYCTKEIKIKLNGKFHSNRIIPSTVLFNIEKPNLIDSN